MISPRFDISGAKVKTKEYFFYRVLSQLVVLIFIITVNDLSAQRLQIDSLKNLIPNFKDSVLADCLNTLSLAYSYLQSDSAILYANKAGNISSEINYLRGEIMSLNNKAHITGLALHNFPLQQEISIQSIKMCKQLNDENLLTDAEMNFALALFCQSDFTQSSEVCNQIIHSAQKSSDYKKSGEATAILGAISFETGNYEKSFEYYNQSLQVFINTNDSYNTAIILSKIGDLYRMAGDDKMALNLYYKSLKYPIVNSIVWYPLADLGDTYYSIEKFDSSSTEQQSYLQTIKALTIRSNYITIPKILVAENYLNAQKYDEALPILKSEVLLSEKYNDRNRMMRSLLDIAKTYERKRDFDFSFKYTRQLLLNAETYKLHQYLRDGYQLMNILYDDIHNTDSAYSYYRQYTAMKDSVAIDEFSKKIALYKAVTRTEQQKQQIELLNKEKLITQQELQLNEQQLKSDSVFKNILVFSVLALLVMSFIIFRNIKLKQRNEISRRQIIENEFKLEQTENEKVKSEMQQKAVELELQAIRAQMNPHFIFNCLNSINRFIISNNAEAAANYLTKFAKLIRIVLEQSSKSFIPLEDEIACLKLYMDLEKLRFEQPFQYTIDHTGIDASSVMIPTLLIQPFVENAIWHGLHPKQNGMGEISITMNIEEHVLHCSVYDNGVGINNAPDKLQTEKKSLGIQLTRQRLQLFDDAAQEPLKIKTEIVTDACGVVAGTRVLINIPFKTII